MVNVNLSQLQPQAYFGNFHKWGFVPKNAGYIYISDEYLDVIQPSITSLYYKQGIDKAYYWTGTRDMTSYLCLPRAEEYVDSIGG